MTGMPQPGDLSPGFFVSPGRCFRLVMSPQLQSTHCAEPAPWQGRWKDARGKVHQAWACEHHAGALDGVRMSFTGSRDRGTTSGP
jgi:hypothetical protein